MNSALKVSVSFAIFNLIISQVTPLVRCFGDCHYLHVALVYDLTKQMVGFVIIALGEGLFGFFEEFV
ncbi:MAG: hypothetical protein GY814_17580 [Gammaproteobacteria bacterium]|nr:hypothetical protein [Gammaproteobacteria bacterium]